MTLKTSKGNVARYSSESIGLVAARLSGLGRIPLLSFVGSRNGIWSVTTGFGHGLPVGPNPYDAFGVVV